MRTDGDHTLSRNGISKSLVASTVATLLVSVSFVAMPTPASAFDLRGLAEVALAQYAAGGFRVGGSHYGYAHVATRHSHHDDDGDDNATPGSTNTPPPQKDVGAAPRRLPDGDHVAYQQAMNSRTMTTGRSYAEEPAFVPSR
jgi:hypothetical protein